MSSVYTESALVEVAKGTAAYIDAFSKAIAQTRIDPEGADQFGGSLLDFFLNVFGTSDPFTLEEVALTATWAVSSDQHWSPGDSQLHRISPDFESEWPPPQIWVTQQDWHPLSQSKPRHRYFGSYRSRK